MFLNLYYTGNQTGNIEIYISGRGTSSGFQESQTVKGAELVLLLKIPDQQMCGNPDLRFGLKTPDRQGSLAFLLSTHPSPFVPTQQHERLLPVEGTQVTDSGQCCLEFRNTMLVALALGTRAIMTRAMVITELGFEGWASTG